MPEHLRAQPCLSHDEVRHAQAALGIEQQEGSPQDVEWAIDDRRRLPTGFFLLQHRPETTWASRPAGAPYDPVEYALRNVFGVPRPRPRHADLPAPAAAPSIGCRS